MSPPALESSSPGYPCEWSFSHSCTNGMIDSLQWAAKRTSSRPFRHLRALANKLLRGASFLVIDQIPKWGCALGKASLAVSVSSILRIDYGQARWSESMTAIYLPRVSAAKIRRIRNRPTSSALVRCDCGGRICDDGMGLLRDRRSLRPIRFRNLW
jgi:hypothetical protein